MDRNNFEEIRPLFASNTTDTSEMAKIIYIGPTPSYGNDIGGVTMANWDPAVALAAHDLTFSLDTGTTVDSTIGTEGVISIDADAADISYGAVAALINASVNWRMILTGARPEDLMYVHSGTLDQCLAITGATANGRACAGDDGTKVFNDTTVTSFGVICIGPEALGDDGGHILGRISEGNIFPGFEEDVANQLPVERSTGNFWNGLVTVSANGTFSAGAAKLDIYEADQVSSNQIYTRTGAASTVEQVTDKDEFGQEVLFGRPGKRLLVRYTAGTTTTVVTMSATGSIGRVGRCC